MASSTFAYGATRSGKTHLMLTMAPAGRILVCDVEGQVQAECPSAFQLTMPERHAKDATDNVKQARIDLRTARIAESRDAAVVAWSCFSPTDAHAMLTALDAGVLGDFAVLGLDSATYLGDQLIANICGIGITHRSRDGGDEDAIDPVFAALPDFTGQGVHRSMEMKDWQRYAQKLSEMLAGFRYAAQRRKMHLIVTALEEQRELYEGEGRAKKFLRLQKGPLLRGRASALDVPPLFGLYFRLESGVPEGQSKPTFCAWTAPRGGWPAGGRGKAHEILKACERDPNLWEILGRCGLR